MVDVRTNALGIITEVTGDDTIVGNDGGDTVGDTVQFSASGFVLPADIGSTVAPQSHADSTANPHAVTPSQIGAVPAAGGTMTGGLILEGDLRVESTFPVIWIKDTNGTIDARTARLVVNGDNFNIEARNDDDSFSGRPVVISLADNSIDFTGASLVQLPTVTSDVEVESGTPSVFWDETDAAVDQGRWRAVASAESFRIQSVTDADALQFRHLHLLRDGTLELTGATKVTVPPPTGVDQPPRIAAFDAATGRRALEWPDGTIAEEGDTGWIDIPDADLLNGWAIANEQTRPNYKRRGDTVQVSGQVTGNVATADTFWMPPIGFRPGGGGGSQKLVTGNWGLSNNSDSGTVRFIANGSELIMADFVTTATIFTIRYFTDDAWPATL